jgi:hypothetical protein
MMVSKHQMWLKGGRRQSGESRVSARVTRKKHHSLRDIKQSNRKELLDNGRRCIHDDCSCHLIDKSLSLDTYIREYSIIKRAKLQLLERRQPIFMLACCSSPFWHSNLRIHVHYGIFQQTTIANKIHFDIHWSRKQRHVSFLWSYWDLGIRRFFFGQPLSYR